MYPLRIERIGEELGVVARPDPRAGRDPVPVVEGHVHALHEREEVERRVDDERRGHVQVPDPSGLSREGAPACAGPRRRPLWRRPPALPPSGSRALEVRVVLLDLGHELLRRDPAHHELLDRGRERVVEGGRRPVLVGNDAVALGRRSRRRSARPRARCRPGPTRSRRPRTAGAARSAGAGRSRVRSSSSRCRRRRHRGSPTRPRSPAGSPRRPSRPAARRPHAGA